MDANPYAALPRTDELLAAASDLVERYGRTDVKAALTGALEGARAAIADAHTASGAKAGSDATASVAAPGADVLFGRILADADRSLAVSRPAGPRRVINAAGIVVHTNLGRAPLTPAAVDAVVAAAGYCDLEFDLGSGSRGSRGSHVDALLAAATGAEDAMAVNNCAAALVLALAGLASGRQVPVSRGHLIEIGGSFRLPEIMAASGAQLLEVGTTNRTRAADYRGGDDVAALLTVHPSNFTQEGFVTQAPLTAVAAVAVDRGVPLIHDAGSGLLGEAADGPLVGELSMRGALDAGADLVLASGDKLLGGPQAGLIVGRADLVEALRRHPLARALRLDKLRLAALNATLRDHLRGEGSVVDAMLAPRPALLDRCRRLVAHAAELRPGAEWAAVEEAQTLVGGGSAPGAGVPSPVVVLADEAMAAALRRHDPPVIARVRRGGTWIDLRTVDPADDVLIADAITAALSDTTDDAAADRSAPRAGRPDAAAEAVR